MTTQNHESTSVSKTACQLSKQTTPKVNTFEKSLYFVRSHSGRAQLDGSTLSHAALARVAGAGGSTCKVASLLD
jgi:hypothetical protein